MKLLILTMFITINANAVTKEECTALNKNYVGATVTINGAYRKAHCRNGRSKLTKAERIKRLNALLVTHPEMKSKIEAKLRSVK